MKLLTQIHAHILTRNSSLPFLLSTLLSSAAFRHLPYATALLSQIPSPSIFAYNSLIRGFLSQTQSYQPIFLFKSLLQNMHSNNSPPPNTFTLASVLKCCANLAAFEEGRQVHKHAVASGMGENLFVRTSLVNFYVKCEEVEMGRKVFEEMPERNVVAWSAMIGGYSRVGMVNEALGMFREMQRNGVEADEVAVVAVMSACAMAGALDLGKWLHAYIDRKGIKNDLEVSTALVNMYGKCGCVEKAVEVFEGMPGKDGKAWSSMIIGFAIHGLGKEALATFERMEEAKVMDFCE